MSWEIVDEVFMGVGIGDMTISIDEENRFIKVQIENDVPKIVEY